MPMIKPNSCKILSICEDPFNETCGGFESVNEHKYCKHKDDMYRSDAHVVIDCYVCKCPEIVRWEMTKIDAHLAGLGVKIPNAKTVANDDGTDWEEPEYPMRGK